MEDSKKEKIKGDIAWIKNCLDGIENDKLRTEELVKTEARIIRKLITEIETLVLE